MKCPPAGSDCWAINRVRVAALTGGFRVLNARGALVANVAAGSALAFEPQAPDAAAVTHITGTLTQQSGHFLLTDQVTHVTVEVTGAGLQAHVGQVVEVTGTLNAAATPVAGATQVIAATSVQTVRPLERGGAAGAAGGGAAAAGAGGAATGVGRNWSNDIAIIGGVAAAATLGGLAASGALPGQSSKLGEPLTLPRIARTLVLMFLGFAVWLMIRLAIAEAEFRLDPEAALRSPQLGTRGESGALRVVPGGVARRRKPESPAVLGLDSFGA